MHPRMAVLAERDQVSSTVMGRIMIAVVNVETPGGSADYAPVAVALTYRIAGRSPSRQPVLEAGPDRLPEPAAEEGVVTSFRERAGVAERPEPVCLRPVPACRSRGLVKRRERELDFVVHATPERKTGLEGFEPPTSGLEARRSILAKPQALATHTMGVSPLLTIGTGRRIYPVPGKIKEYQRA
jgi:hypothetical protein